MSLVDRHEMGMLSSVMRALKHTGTATVGSAIDAAVGPGDAACRSATSDSKTTPHTPRTVSPAGTIRPISGFGPLF